MFDSKRSRAAVTLRARALTTGAALAIVCPFAALRIDAAPVQSPPTPPRRAELPHAPSASAPLPSVAPARTEDIEPAAIGARDTARIPPSADVRVPILQPPTRRLAGHPDLSGTWTQDTVAEPVDSLVTDSTTFTQTSLTISIDARGHRGDVSTHNWVHDVWFDGADGRGVAKTGDSEMPFAANAVWVGDTLVVTSHAEVRGHVLHTIERMTLAADGNTMLITNHSYLDGKYRWDGPHTFLLRRVLR